VYSQQRQKSEERNTKEREKSGVGRKEFEMNKWRE
jgi:hypothetical protein